MKIIRSILLFCLFSVNYSIHAMSAAATWIAKSAAYMAGRHVLYQASPAIGSLVDNALFIYDMGQFYTVLKSKPKTKPNTDSASLSNEGKIYQVDTQNYLYLQDGHLFKSNGEKFEASKNACRIQNGVVRDIEGNVVDTKTFLDQSKAKVLKVLGENQLSQSNKSWFNVKLSVTPSRNRQFGYVQVAKCSEQFCKNIGQLEHGMLGIIVKDPQVALHGRVDGLYAHLVDDYSKLSVAEQYKYNIATKYINQITRLIYDENGKFKGVNNINTDRIAEIYSQYLAEMYGQTIARIKIQQLARQNVPEFQRIHDRIDDVCHKSAGFVKQMGKSSWSSLKYLFNVKEKPNLDTDFLNRVQQNEFNQHLAQVHNLNDQGYCLEALSVGDKTGVFKVNPGLRKSIVQRFETALNLKAQSPIVQGIYRQLINGQDIEQLFASLSKLSANHYNPAIRNAYKTFFNEQGIFRFAKCNPRVLDGILIPKNIGDVQFVKHRELLTKYAMLSSLPSADIKGINFAIKYVCKSMEKTKNAQQYFKLADKALQGGYYQLFSAMGDLATVSTNSAQQIAQKSILDTTTRIVDTLSQKTNTMSETKHKLFVQALLNCCEANQLNNKGLTKQASGVFVAKVALPLCNTNEFRYLKTLLPQKSYKILLPPKVKQQIKQQAQKRLGKETGTIQELLQRYTKDNSTQLTLDSKYNKKVIADRAKAFQKVGSGNESWTEKRYTLCVEAQSLLAANKIDSFAFEYCYGNEIMQQFHSECVDVLNRTAKLQTNATTQPLVDLVPALATASNMCAQEGMIKKSSELLDACYALYDFGKSIHESVDSVVEVVGDTLYKYAPGSIPKGLVRVGKNITHTVLHPIECAYNMYDVVKRVGSTLATVIKENNALQTPEQAKTLMQQRLNIMIGLAKELNKQDIDLLEEATAFGVEWFAGPWVYGKIGNFIIKTAAPAMAKAIQAANQIGRSRALKVAQDGIKLTREYAYSLLGQKLTTNWQKLTKPFVEVITPDGKKLKIPLQNFMDKAKAAGGAANKMMEKARSYFQKSKKLLSNFDDKIKELSKHVSNKRVGKKITMETSSLKVPKILEEAEKYYDKIRSISEDVAAISKNTGISKNIISKIKNHLFIEKHILGEGIRKFLADPDIAAAWERLINNKFVYSDLKLLQHEYAESLIMRGLEIDYNTAHSIVNKVYNWDKLL